MNKTLLTVSQVFVAIHGGIAIIYGILFLSIYNAVEANGLLDVVGFALLLIFTLYVVIFIRLGQAKDNPYMKTEVIVWSILLFFSSNFIAGLCAILGALLEPPTQNKGWFGLIRKKVKRFR